LTKFSNFIGNKHDDISADYKAILQTNKQQKQEIRQLNRRTENLQKRNCDDEIKIDELEQYDRRQNLELEGVPVTDDEDLVQVTVDLAQKMDVKLNEEDISIVHRLPLRQRPGRTRSSSSNTTKHPTIIVRFISRLKRNEMYANRSKAKYIEDFGIHHMNSLYVNENLTQRRKRLFWLAKQKAKELNYRFWWSNNGQIYVRENKESE